MKRLYSKNFLTFKLTFGTLILTVIFHYGYKEFCLSQKKIITPCISKLDKNNNKYYDLNIIETQLEVDKVHTVDLNEFDKNARVIPSSWTLEFLSKVRNEIGVISPPKTPESLLEKSKRKLLTFKEIFENLDLATLIGLFAEGGFMGFIKKLVRDLASLIWQWFKDMIIDKINEVCKFIREQFEKGIKSLFETIKKACNIFMVGFKYLKGKVCDLYNGGRDIIKKGVHVLRETASYLCNGTWSVVTYSLSEVKESASVVYNGTWNGVVKSFKVVTTMASVVYNGTWNGVVKGYGAVWAMIWGK